MISLLRFEQVDFSYPGGRGALREVNFSVREKDFLLITGPSGAGKSTLLRLLVRLEEPGSGRIFYRGKPLEEYPPSVLRRKICLLPQTPLMVEGSIRDNLLLPFRFAANREMAAPGEDVLREWLKRLELAEIPLDESAQNLSVGQEQRLCLIRLLLLEPEIALLDEPTSALDAQSRDIVTAVTEERNCDGMAILHVSHSDYRPRVPYRHLDVREQSIAEIVP